MDFSDDNVGRPNGPSLNVSLSGLAYKAPPITDRFGPGGVIANYAVPFAVLPCAFESADYPNLLIPHLAYAQQLTCPPSSGSGTSSDDGTDAGVDQVVAAFANEQQPVYQLSFNRGKFGGVDCIEWVFGTGRVLAAGGFEPCDHLQITYR